MQNTYRPKRMKLKPPPRFDEVFRGGIENMQEAPYGLNFHYQDGNDNVELEDALEVH